jgi:hypothetical protein
MSHFWFDFKFWYNLLSTVWEFYMPQTEKFFCTDVAWEHGAPLMGTATRGDIWFLLEYPERWGAKAFEESALSQEIKDHLDPKRFPDVEVRTQLVRQDQSRHREGICFFVGQTHPLEPKLFEYHLQDYADLLDIDVSSLAAGQPVDPTLLRAEPLYLVCTNGKRDQCCSIYGPETYQAMAEEAGDAVWQSSHIGGHNQAPITLFFPHGVNYGHTTPSEARRLMRAYQDGQVVLHHYRGRVCYEPSVQAAEHFWREQTGILDLPGMQIESIEDLEINEWVINIQSLDSEASTAIHLQRRFSDFEIPITCSKKKLRPISTFHRLDKSNKET